MSRRLCSEGVFRYGDVRISDLSGRKALPIGDSSFTTAVQDSVFIDKSMLIADVIDGGSKVTLYCRPRRFGKSLNLSMLQRFFETPSPDDPSALDTEPLFRGLAIWDAEGGAYQRYHQRYPVVRFSFNNLKSSSYEAFAEGMASAVSDEYGRHEHLASSERLGSKDKAAFSRILHREGTLSDVRGSLALLTQLLFKHYGVRAVVLIDEYDAPVMAGYSHGYYADAVEFLKSWLTGALKDNDALAFACLTGVQRISKESIFSDLNNMVVNTSLNVRSDERFGFTDEEVAALSQYLGASGCMEDVRRWYDGYRFGNVDIYNPWSVLNYFHSGCVADIYWGNTAGNAVLGDMVRDADERTLESLYRLMEPEGTVLRPLDLGVVFPDVGVREGAVFSMLYLAGYLTTNDTQLPNNYRTLRALRIPNQEIAELYRGEIVERFGRIAGGGDRLVLLHEALAAGDAKVVESELTHILEDSASYFDLVRENSYHMLLLGLLFGMRGYGDPRSNRESGDGRFDIQLLPEEKGELPAITVEVKCLLKKGSGSSLPDAAAAALEQIKQRGYDKEAHGGEGRGALRFGIAFRGKEVAVDCGRA